MGNAWRDKEFPDICLKSKPFPRRAFPIPKIDIKQEIEHNTNDDDDKAKKTKATPMECSDQSCGFKTPDNLATLDQVLETLKIHAMTVPYSPA